MKKIITGISEFISNQYNRKVVINDGALIEIGVPTGNINVNNNIIYIVDSNGNKTQMPLKDAIMQTIAQMSISELTVLKNSIDMSNNIVVNAIEPAYVINSMHNSVVSFTMHIDNASILNVDNINFLLRVSNSTVLSALSINFYQSYIIATFKMPAKNKCSKYELSIVNNDIELWKQSLPLAINNFETFEYGTVIYTANDIQDITTIDDTKMSFNIANMSSEPDGALYCSMHKDLPAHYVLKHNININADFVMDINLPIDDLLIGVHTDSTFYGLSVKFERFKANFYIKNRPNIKFDYIINVTYTQFNGALLITYYGMLNGNAKYFTEYVNNNETASFVINIPFIHNTYNIKTINIDNMLLLTLS